ncbi:Integrase catalytic domain containing protein [Tylopilus felleus]
MSWKGALFPGLSNRSWQNPPSTYWSPNISCAYDILQNAYQHAAGLLRQEDCDPLHIHIHVDQITQQMLPLLEMLHCEMEEITWTTACATIFGQLLCSLEKFACSASRHIGNLIHIIPVISEPSGRYRAGRPCLKFDTTWLADAVSPSRHIPKQTLARTLGVHQNMLHRHMKMNGISKEYSPITDDYLETLICHYKRDRPNAGLCFVTAFLTSHGLRVQRARIQSSMQCINPLGRFVCYSNAIQWRVVGLHANIDNRAQTVLELFLAAIRTYRMPSCVRGDRGGENIDVAIWMIEHCGPNQSFLWGRSTQNSHIEWLWVDTGINFVCRWKAFFVRLEDIHYLDVGNPHHLWLLHFLFLRKLNDDCQQFQHDWNHHPISKRGHNQSPLDMRFLSVVQHGTYAEPKGLDFASGDIQNGTDSDLVADIIAEQYRNIKHAAIAVPTTTSPFPTAQAFEETQDCVFIPTGYGVTEAEWPGGSYPEVELITIGRGKREYAVELPFEVWWTCSVLWVQGLDVMTRICMIANEEL